MKQKKLTVTIGTSAYNEENSIKTMLSSVIKQKEKSFVIKEILVISDGSSDKTVEKALSLKDKRIKVINDHKRLGQPARINELLRTFTTDILVLLDADMFVRDSDGIEKLVKTFTSDTNVGLVAGLTQTLPAETFIESAIKHYKDARASLEDEFSFESTAYGAHAYIAYSKKFAKSVKLPKDLLSHDSYSYFECISKGFKYCAAKDSVVLYRSPQTILEHIKQSTRHLAGGIQLRKYFNPELVDRGFYVPWRVLLKLMFIQIRKNILGYVFLKILNTYCSFRSRMLVDKMDNKWEVVTTSKKLYAS